MEDQQNNQQNSPATDMPTAAPMPVESAPAAAPQAAPVAAQPAPAPMPVEPAPVAAQPVAAAAQAAPSPAMACKCPVIDPTKWDGQKMQLDKAFYKAFSPRILGMPFSFAIDLDRAMKGAKKKGYVVVENPMILDTLGMFMANVMVEVTGADTNDKSVVSLAGKEVYSKLSKREWKDIKLDIADLEKELGHKPSELYAWWVACPKCVKDKEVKAILLAV